MSLKNKNPFNTNNIAPQLVLQDTLSQKNRTDIHKRPVRVSENWVRVSYKSETMDFKLRHENTVSPGNL